MAVIEWGVMRDVCGYLDIETTGFSSRSAELTVIGLYVVYDKNRTTLFQPYGNQISPRTFRKALADVEVVYTYNGKKFDLPFIEAKLGVSVEKKCRHEDLMYACWKRGLYGGLKVVERLLKIPRATSDIDGWMAVQLWHNFSFYGDASSLTRLLTYNREDVTNLSKLRSRLSR